MGVVGIGTPPLSPFSQQAWANRPITQRIRDMGVSAQLDWTIGAAKLTSITAWRDNTQTEGNDIDYSGLDISYSPGSGNLNLTDFKQFSEELRLAGKSGDLDWLVGAFFSSESLTSNTTIVAGDNFDAYVGLASSAAVGSAESCSDPVADG